MKILTIVYNLDKGGTQRAAQVFSEAYHEIGYDSRILAMYGLGSRYEEVKDTLLVFDGINDKNLLDIKSWNPDILHIHSHGPKDVDINKIIMTLPNAKIIETNVFSIPSPWANKVAVSFQLSYWAQWLFNLRGGARYESAIIPYPVKCNNFQKSSITEISEFRSRYEIPIDAFVIGRIGQSFLGKWSPLLIESFNDFADINNNTYLLIINPPKNIIELSDSSPFKNRIIHIPSIFGDNNLSLAYSSMDVMLHIAEQGESFGMVLAEAILCETPVITFSTPWADNSQCEVVKNAVGGYVVNSHKGILESIYKIYNGGNYFSSSGRDHTYTNYDYINVAKNAIAESNNIEESNNKVDIIGILNDSFDKPSLGTVLLLKSNNDFFRRLTRYTSGYNSWSNFIVKIIKKIMRLK